MTLGDPLLPASDSLQSAFRRVPVWDGLDAGLHGKHLLLTGATGFFGQWLLDLLASLNARGTVVHVTAVSRDPEAFLARHPFYRQCRWLRWLGSDIRHIRDLDPGKLDLVLHAAADTSAAAHRDPLILFDSIVNGAWALLDLAVRCGAQRILFTGSGAQYGSFVDSVPAAENSPLACDSSLAGNAYAEAKRAQEILGAIYAKSFDLDVVLTRCFTFAGAGLPLDGHFAIGNFVRDALRADAVVVESAGDAVRSYLHGADLAVWLLALLIEGRQGEVYNVGSDQAVTIAELALRVLRRLAPHKPLRIIGQPSEGRPYYIPDISKARAQGLDVWISLDEIIDDMARCIDGPPIVRPQ